MMWPHKLKLVFKTCSGLIAGIFLWNQIAWAGDLYSPIDEFNEQQSQQFAPDYVNNQQTTLEHLVNQKQDIENTINIQDLTGSQEEPPSEEDILNLQGPKGEIADGVVLTEPPAEGEAEQPLQLEPVFSFVTEDGDIIHYADNEIDYIEKKDGTIFWNVVLDENNNLLDADIEYTDGTMQIVRQGKVTKMTLPDGTIYNYNSEELVESIVYPDETSVAYSYLKDEEGNILETILTDSEKITYYDSEERLKKVEFNSGKIIEYNNGVLSKVTDEDGKIYIYEETEEILDNETVYTVKLKEIIDTKNNIFRLENDNIVEIEYPDSTLIKNFLLDENGYIISGKIEYPDGTKILVENGRIKEIEDTNNVKSTYQYTFDKNGEVKACEVTIDDNGDIKQYKYIKDLVNGTLTIKDGNKTYEYDVSGNLEKFTDDIGVFEHSYDIDGTYLGSIFSQQDGAVKTYNADRNLTETVFDGTVYEYYQAGPLSGKLKKATLPDGKAIIYDYKITPEGNLAVYKRVSYDKNNCYQGYYSNAYIDYTQNPTLKLTFNLESAKRYSSVYAGAYYYQY
ncbi:MAG: hypothetical protein JSV93_02590, partial [Candidatus Omnitrophota bacterium]